MARSPDGTQLLAHGPNPLVVIAPGQAPAAGAATPDLYATNTLSRDAYLAPAAELAPCVGDVVGSELRGLFWAVASHGSGFAAIPLATNLQRSVLPEWQTLPTGGPLGR